MTAPRSIGGGQRFSPFFFRSWYRPALLCLLCVQLCAQNTNRPMPASVSPRSFPAKLPSALIPPGLKNDTLVSLLNFIERNQYSSLSQALPAAEKANQIAENTHDRLAQAYTQYWLAWLNYQKGAFSTAQAFAVISSNLFNEAGEEHLHMSARTQALLGALHKKIANGQDPVADADAHECIQNARRLCKTLKHHFADSVWTLALTNKTELLLTPPDSLPLAAELLKQNLELYGSIADTFGLAGTAYNLAVFYYKKGDLLAMQQQFELALDLFTQISCPIGLQETYWAYASLCTRLYDSTAVDQWHDLAYTLLQKGGKIEGGKHKCEILSQWGLLFHTRLVVKSGRDHKVNLDSMVYYYNRALLMSTEEDDAECLRNLIQNMAITCVETNTCDTVIKSMSATYEKIIKTKKTETEEAQKKISDFERQKSRADRQRAYYFAALLIGIIIAIFGFIHLKDRIQNLEARKAKAQAEQKALKADFEALKAQQALWRAQINPHFISNALNAIESLVNYGRNKEASHYIIQFARLARMVLEHSATEAVSLEDELTALRYYIDLEHLRLGDEVFTYNIGVDAGLDQQKVLIPPMLFQPFVENAIWHGLHPKAGGGVLRLTITKRTENSLLCIIEDNGIGREKAKELRKQSIVKQKSWGLTLTQLRIETLKEMEGGSVDVIDLHSPEGLATGTQIRIILPIKLAPDDQSSDS